jgi:hypothetical protein
LSDPEFNQRKKQTGDGGWRCESADIRNFQQAVCLGLPNEHHQKTEDPHRFYYIADVESLYLLPADQNFASIKSP